MRFCIAALLAVCFSVSATTYGRSKIQVEGYEWWTITARGVQLYYPVGCETLAESLLAISTAEIDKLAFEFGFMPEDEISIVAYPSPGSFRQTDIIGDEIGEAVGGFTEYFKGRVVVPFTGSWTEFRHVLTHEINHAYVFDMLYHRSLQSVISSPAALWTMEGLAEYTSNGWDPASEAEFRDMVITGQIVPVDQLSRRSDYLVYREGQAIYHFMVERYGRDRYHDFVHRMASRGGLSDAMDGAFDMTVSQFSDRFLQWARETYWAQLADRENPSDLGRALEDGNQKRVVQAVTVLSPDGSKIAGVESYRGGYAVTVRSAVTGEVTRRCAQTGGVRNTGISPLYRVCAFSPGGDSVAVAVHGANRDRLFISTSDGDIDLPVEMDLIRDPAWSPDGSSIAFCAMEDSASPTDVYVWNRSGLRRMTETPGGERDLVWAASGLIASSENSSRGGWDILRIDPTGASPSTGAAPGSPSALPYPVEILYSDSCEIRYPFETPSGLVFQRNEGGVPDLFLLDSTGTVRRLTNLYLTMDSPSWADSGRVMSFDSPDWSGYGVYLAYGVLDREVPGPAGAADVAGDMPAEPEPPIEEEAVREDSTPVEETGAVEETATADGAGTARDVRAEAEIHIAPYTPVLSTDYVSALAGYDSYSGFEGYTTFVFSDVLARHQLVLNGNFNGPVSDADAAVYYSYMPMRTDLGAYAFRETTQYLFRFPDDHLEQVRDVDTGGGAVARYPFTMALSARGGVDYRHITRQGVWNSDADYSADVLAIHGGLILDTALWDWVGPRLGERLSVKLEVAPGWGGLVGYTTASADLRKYVWLSSQAALALRLAGATSWGPEAQRFLIGGAVPHRIMTGESRELDDLLGFYTNYGDMLRGLDYTELSGRNYVSTTAELRVPFIRTISLDAPIPLTFSNIRGVVFADAGTAFDEPSGFVGAETSGGYRFKDVAMGFGFGFRANLGIFLLREDTAWSTDMRGVSEKPIHYISLGASF